MQVLLAAFAVSMVVELTVAWVISKSMNLRGVTKSVAIAVVISYIIISAVFFEFPGVSLAAFFFVMLIPEIGIEAAVISVISGLDSLTSVGISSASNFFAFIAVLIALKLI